MTLMEPAARPGTQHSLDDAVDCHILAEGQPPLFIVARDNAFAAVDDALAMDGIFGPPDNLADPNNTATTGIGSESSLLKSVEGWLKQNPNLAKLGLSGVAGLAGAYSANKAGQNSMDQLKEQEAQKLRTRERVSDSILGMAPLQVAGAQPLQRLDGTRVFGQDGKIMR